MKPYKSRIAAVLRLAKAEERTKQGELARAARRTNAARDDVAARRQALDASSGRDAAADTVRDLQAARERSMRQAEGVKLSEADLADQLAEQLHIQGELLASVRRRKRVEEFESRREATYAALASRIAQKSIDDLASLRRTKGPRR